MAEVVDEHPTSVAITVLGIGGNILLESYLIDVRSTLAELESLLQLISLAEYGQNVVIKLMCGCQELSNDTTIQCLNLPDNVVLTSVTCSSGGFDYHRRIQAATTLMKSSGADLRERGRRAFTMAFQDPNESVRCFAAIALGTQENRELATELHSELVMLLRDPSSNVCQHAVNSLGAIKSPATSNIITLLCDKDWSVRGWACAALMAVGGSVVSELELVKCHRNPDVRRRARSMLHDLKATL